MPYFYFRLIPPRETFPGDMTETEREAMNAHAGYWREQAKVVNVLAMGPVKTATGAFGMGVVETDDLETAQTLADNDPVALSGLGFRMEVSPMFGMIKTEH
jgi:uncharacterized protein YciI